MDDRATEQEQIQIENESFNRKQLVNEFKLFLIDELKGYINYVCCLFILINNIV